MKKGVNNSVTVLQRNQISEVGQIFLSLLAMIISRETVPREEWDTELADDFYSFEEGQKAMDDEQRAGSEERETAGELRETELLHSQVRTQTNQCCGAGTFSVDCGLSPRLLVLK